MYPAPATSSFSKPSGSGKCGDDLFGNLARRLAQPLCQLKRQRQGELAQFDLRRLLDDNVGQFDLILVAEKRPNRCRQLLLLFQVHEYLALSRRLGRLARLLFLCASVVISKGEDRVSHSITKTLLHAGLTLL